MNDFLAAQNFTILGVFVVVTILAIIIGIAYKRYDPLKASSRFQMLIEMGVNFFEDMTAGIFSQEHVRVFVPLTITMFLTIFLTNIAGVFLLTEGAFINPIYTFTWSFSMFLFWNIYGMKKLGLFNYLKDIATPIPLLPLEILGMMTKPISMGLRLLGNVSGGSIIMIAFWFIPDMIFNMMMQSNLLGFIGFGVLQVIVVSMGSMLSAYFSLFGPFIQAMVFTMLTLVSLQTYADMQDEG